MKHGKGVLLVEVYEPIFPNPLLSVCWKKYHIMLAVLVPSYKKYSNDFTRAGAGLFRGATVCYREQAEERRTKSRLIFFQLPINAHLRCRQRA